jgi:hypothetical protein
MIGMKLASSVPECGACGGTPEGEEIMKNKLNAEGLVDRIDALREPYRKHAIEWVESYAKHPISDLPRDIRRVLRKMPRSLREEFYSKTVQVLDGAAQHFGR